MNAGDPTPPVTTQDSASGLEVLVGGDVYAVLSGLNTGSGVTIVERVTVV